MWVIILVIEWVKFMVGIGNCKLIGAKIKFQNIFLKFKYVFFLIIQEYFDFGTYYA